MPNTTSSTKLQVPPLILSDDPRLGPSSGAQPFSYPIVDINLVLVSTLSLVHVLPHAEGEEGALDPETLVKAVGVAAGRMRSCCGRVRKRGSGDERQKHAYELVFTDSPVPLEIDLSPSSARLPSHDVLQPNALLEPFLPPFQPLAGRVGPDEPLLALKFTRVVGADVIGIGFHHVLGDADLASQFGDLLGRVYAALREGKAGASARAVEKWEMALSPEEIARVEAASLPFYTTAHLDFPDPPEGDIAADQPECIQSLAQPTSTCMELYGRLFAPDAPGRPPVPLTIRLDPTELAALKETLGARSAQEAVAAWWIELLRASEREGDGGELALFMPGKIARVVRMVSYRHLGEAQRAMPILWTLPESADLADPSIPLLRCIGNVVQTKTTDIPVRTASGPPSLSACKETMLALREDLDDLRTSPERLSRWLQRAAREYRRAIEPDMGVYFGPTQDEVVINAVRAHDWRPEFGLGESARRRQRFHTSWTAPRFGRIYKPNPSDADPTCAGAELGFEAWPAVAERIERTIALHRKAGWRAEGEGWQA